MRLVAFLSTVVALALVTALPAQAQGYGNCEVSGAKGSISIKPVTPGQLTVGAILPAPGWFNGDTAEAVKDGYEYCIAANIAYRAGLDKVVVANESRDAFMTGKAKNFDLALGEFTITPERQKVVTFSVPYFTSDMGVLVRNDSKVTQENLRTKHIGVRLGTTGYAYANNILKPTESLKVFSDSAEIYTAVIAGQLEVAMSNTPYLLGQAANSNGKLKVIGRFENSAEDYGAIFPAGNNENQAAINKALQDMKSDGTLAALEKKQLDSKWGVSVSSIPVWKP